jgi:hypothetical protein
MVIVPAFDPLPVLEGDHARCNRGTADHIPRLRKALE